MQEAKKNVILRVFRTAHCPPGKYFFGVTCSALSVLLSGVPFYTVYRIIRLFLLASLDGAAAPTHEIWMWAAVTIGSIVLGIVLSVIGSFSCHACAFNALYDLRMRLLDHMGRLNLGFYTGGQSGATQKMMNENIEKMENIIAHDVSNIFGAGLLLAALAVLMFSLNIPLALTIFIALVLAFLIQFSAFGGKQGQKIWSDLNRSSTELDAAFSEYVAGMEEEKIFGRPEAAARRLTGLVEKNREHWKVYLKRVTPIFGAYKTITISVLAFLLVSGCALLYLHPGDHELMMELLMFLIVGPACISPLMELVEFGADLRNLAVRMDQIDEVLNMQPISEGTETAPKGGAEIVFQDVSFSYQNAADPLRRMALDHLIMEIPAGSFAALVGPSGGGKSTAGQLIARFWDVRKGQITIGGIDVSTIEPEHLMRCMSFVFQDVTLFNDTVFNNIRVGNMNATEEQVMAAAKAAYCDEFIQRLPDGYQTVLGENGSTLSGGERQRISIARALLKDAPIILLDEATASLDPENEVLIQRAIAKLVEGKTVIIIAHRLRTVVDADQILVLDNGRLVEHGTHDELMKKNGLYHKLFHIQQESLGWAV